MLAVLYDVHGNLLALDAVLADARAHGADRWLLGGDYAAFGGWPEETVARLRELEHAQWIRGNADRWLADASDVPADGPVAPALAACREALGPQLVSELVALPERLTLYEGLFCHASPLNDMESFGAEPERGEERLLNGVQADRVVFGHTHVQFARRGPGGVELVNPGSVGIPLDGDHRAAYALLHEEEWQVEHRRVHYDHEAAAERLGERFDRASWTEIFARRIRTARLE
jgi:predicted phosphodiesterase